MGSNLKKTGLAVVAILAVFLSAIFLYSDSVYAEVTLTISNSGETISFDKVQPSSSGTITKATDTLSVDTNCTEGVDVYLSAVSGGSTSLVNNTANSNNEISTLSNTTIGTTAFALSNNTWGFNIVDNNTYYGLPTYANALSHVVYSGTNSSIPIYYGAKVTNSIATGKYNGSILYTAMVNSACLNYTVEFNKNATDATGTMENQIIAPPYTTSLVTNAYARDDYTFLGWSTSETGKTGNVVDGVGTIDDVDFEDGGSVADIAVAFETRTLYAVWKKNPMYMQNPISCSTVIPGDVDGSKLVDSRDEQEYTVYRFPKTGTAGTNYPKNMAGYCIMTKDLALGNVTGGSVTRGTSLTLTANDSAGATTITNQWANNSYNYQYKITGGRAYYSHNAAKQVCPRGWRLLTSDEYYNSLRDFMGGNSAAGSTKIQSAPYNFTYGGMVNGNGSYQSGNGYYWTSSEYDSTNGYYLYINGSGFSTNYTAKSAGMSVRCITKTVDGYMQDFNPSTALRNNGDFTNLVDKRDGKTYSVKRLADGKVWMTQDLTLGSAITDDNGLALTKEDTNIDNDTIYYLPPAGKQGTGTIDQRPNVNGAPDTANFVSDTDTDRHAKTQFRGSATGYYNFYTATLGHSYYGDNINYKASTRDICPKGWRLPKTPVSIPGFIYSVGPDNDFAYLASSYSTAGFSWSNKDSMRCETGNESVKYGMRDAANFSIVGKYSGTSLTDYNNYPSGNTGYFWSATDGHGLRLNNTYTYPQWNLGKSSGLAIHCIAREDYSIIYDANGGSGTMEPSIFDAGRTLPLSPNTFTRDGYTFTGWSTDPNATSATYKDGGDVTSLASANESITLYAVWTPTIGDMQTTSCSSLAINSVSGLTDSRDGQNYTVYRWPNSGTAGTSYPSGMAGYCIMTKDLSLGYVTGGPAGNEITRGADLILTEDTSVGSGTVTARTSSQDWANDNTGKDQYANGTGGAYDNHSYYSYFAAKIICPKGWRLFNGSEADNLRSFMKNTTIVNNVPYNFYVGGQLYKNTSSISIVELGQSGYYWLDNGPSTSSYYYFETGGYFGRIDANSSAYHGLAVRCVAEP